MMFHVLSGVSILVIILMKHSSDNCVVL